MARDSHPDNLGDTVAAHVPDRSPAQVVELQFGHARGGARLPPGKSKLFDRHSVTVEHGRAAVRILTRQLQPVAHVAIENRNRPAMPGLGICRTQRDKALLPVHLVPSDRKQLPETDAREVARHEQWPQIVWQRVPKQLVLLVGEESLANMRLGNHGKYGTTRIFGGVHLRPRLNAVRSIDNSRLQVASLRPSASRLRLY